MSCASVRHTVLHVSPMPQDYHITAQETLLLSFTFLALCPPLSPHHSGSQCHTYLLVGVIWSGRIGSPDSSVLKASWQSDQSLLSLSVSLLFLKYHTGMWGSLANLSHVLCLLWGMKPTLLKLRREAMPWSSSKAKGSNKWWLLSYPEAPIFIWWHICWVTVCGLLSNSIRSSCGSSVCLFVFLIGSLYSPNSGCLQFSDSLASASSMLRL